MQLLSFFSFFLKKILWFYSFRIKTVALCCSRLESAVWKLAEEVQEQQRLAEALGGLHQLQPVFLQVSPGDELARGPAVHAGDRLTPPVPFSLLPSIASGCRISSLCAMLEV